MRKKPTIRARKRDAVIQALRAGVAPSQGIELLQVGREREVQTIVKDMERIADQGAAFRLISGDYGSGKTFLLHLARQVARKMHVVTMHADLSPNRRLVASGGQARNLYSELVKNMATQTKPDGGALGNIIEKFVQSCLTEAQDSGQNVDNLIHQRLLPLQDYVGGYDMTGVLQQYALAHESGDDTKKEAAMRWLRGEFTTKTDARSALGVRTIIDDTMLFDALKLLAHFVSIAGYAGALVTCDEGVNIYKITNAVSRKSNYEKILTILNSTLQGDVRHFGMIIGVTPEALEDPRRGLFSYEALASRLRPNEFARQTGLTDFDHPVITLPSLSQEELYLLLHNIRHVFAGGDPDQYLISDEGLQSFMAHCHQNIGSAYYKTPRETARSFVNLLSLLEQNPDQRWEDMIDKITIAKDTGGQDELNAEILSEDSAASRTGDPDDDLTSFKL